MHTDVEPLISMPRTNVILSLIIPLKNKKKDFRKKSMQKYYQ